MTITSHNTKLTLRIGDFMDKLAANAPREVSFYCETKTRYYKVITLDSRVMGDQASHCFIDRTTGELFKPHSWNKPSPHARYNLLDDASFEQLLQACDPDGTYLYQKVYHHGIKRRSQHKKPIKA